MSEFITILHAASQGATGAAAQLLPLVYDELRKLAAQMLACEKPGHTLQPTALVHEAYLRLVGPRGEPGEQPTWDGRGGRKIMPCVSRAIVTRLVLDR